jgi:hypothetical protein
MKKITKANLPSMVSQAFAEAKLDHRDFPNLALSILQSSAIELDARDSNAPADFMEMIVIGVGSRQGIRTSGRNVNLFALAGVIIAAAQIKSEVSSFVTLFVALLGACTINLSAEQAAFFLAADNLKESNTIPTGRVMANQMGMFLNDAKYSVERAVDVAKQLQQMGVQVNVGDMPNQIIRYSETAVFLPFF